jgi:hypothetical protein
MMKLKLGYFYQAYHQDQVDQTNRVKMSLHSYSQMNKLYHYYLTLMNVNALMRFE